MDTEVCTCGRAVTLSETTLRNGAQTVGCVACCFTGRSSVRITHEILMPTNTTTNPPTKDTTP